ncbi:MAG: hypothetical protein ACLP59_09150 [Bryobacteraceae bacterium]
MVYNLSGGKMAANGVGRAPDAEGSPAPQREAERLNFNVSPAVAQEVRAMAAEMDVSMTQLFRYAFGILKIAMSEAKRNRKLMIADEEGRPVREIVLPG